MTNNILNFANMLTIDLNKIKYTKVLPTHSLHLEMYLRIHHCAHTNAKG